MIRTLLDMLELNNANLLSAVGYLTACVADFRKQIQLMQKGIAGSTSMDSEMRVWIIASLERLREASEDLGMRASTAACQRAHEASLTALSTFRPLGSRDLEALMTLLSQAVQVFSDEMRGQFVFCLPGKHAAHFGEPVPFGQSVENAFPSAAFDIVEAAKCRAVGRWTASVMHLMRVLEAGLASLACHYGVAVDRNWNKTLNEIEAKTRDVSKRTHGEDAEQWAAEAATHLRFVKNAWRNQAMHPRQIYDEERAVAIFDSARSFMQHLSEKLSEDAYLSEAYR